MADAFFASLEAVPVAHMLRGSRWAYPVVNTGHIIGIALLYGSIVPLDLRLLGFWRSVPLAPLLRVLSSTALFGATLAIVCGVLLFAVRASEYAGSTVFAVKMIVVAAGLGNGLVVRLAIVGRRPPLWVTEGTVPAGVRGAAWFSLIAWTTALLLGRLIGYV